MIHIDLFSGIGGFAIAAKPIGWDTLVTCENIKALGNAVVWKVVYQIFKAIDEIYDRR